MCLLTGAGSDCVCCAVCSAPNSEWFSFWGSAMVQVKDKVHFRTRHKGSKGGSGSTLIIIIIIIIIIYCNSVVTRWQWLFYMYTECEIGYY